MIRNGNKPNLRIPLPARRKSALSGRGPGSTSSSSSGSLRGRMSRGGADSGSSTYLTMPTRSSGRRFSSPSVLMTPMEGPGQGSVDYFSCKPQPYGQPAYDAHQYNAHPPARPRAAAPPPIAIPGVQVNGQTLLQGQYIAAALGVEGIAPENWMQRAVLGVLRGLLWLLSKLELRITPTGLSVGVTPTRLTFSDDAALAPASAPLPVQYHEPPPLQRAASQ